MGFSDLKSIYNYLSFGRFKFYYQNLILLFYDFKNNLDFMLFNNKYVPTNFISGSNFIYNIKFKRKNKTYFFINSN